MQTKCKGKLQENKRDKTQGSNQIYNKQNQILIENKNIVERWKWYFKKLLQLSDKAPSRGNTKNEYQIEYIAIEEA